MNKSTIFWARALLCAVVISGTSLFAQTTISGNDLVVNGESFFAAANITSELSRMAREDGVLASGDNFKSIAVSGAPIASILNFYNNCNPKPTYLISDGAGIDLMQGNCSDENCSVIQNCKGTLEQYLQAMRNGGTEKLLWMIYPDPQGGNWANLKNNQDIWARVVPEVMADVTDPEVLLVDLRETWDGHYNEYTSDGIHCTSAGGTATAVAFWDAIMEANWFGGGPVTGCTDSEADNYDAAAEEDDGNCEYAGCTNEQASNYFCAEHPAAYPCVESNGYDAGDITSDNSCAVGIFWKNFSSKAKIGSDISQLQVHVTEPVEHEIMVYDVKGNLVNYRKGHEPAHYSFGDITQPGLYFLKVATEKHSMVRRVLFW